jgi:hypothetical protein
MHIAVLALQIQRNQQRGQYDCESFHNKLVSARQVGIFVVFANNNILIL